SVSELVGARVRSRRQQGEPERRNRCSQESAPCDTAGVVTGADIEAAVGGFIGVVRNIHVPRIERRGIINAGINDDVGLVVTSTCEQVGVLFTSVIRETQIRVAIAGVNLQPTEAVNQKYVHHTSDSLGAVNWRSTVLQDVDVIDQTQWK